MKRENIEKACKIYNNIEAIENRLKVLNGFLFIIKNQVNQEENGFNYYISNDTTMGILIPKGLDEQILKLMVSDYGKHLIKAKKELENL